MSASRVLILQQLGCAQELHMILDTGCAWHLEGGAIIQRSSSKPTDKLWRSHRHRRKLALHQESLEAKKAVDAAFATSDLHRANARAARKEFEEFVEKTQGVKAIFKFNKKSTQRELLSIVERERNAALESESKAVEMSQKFQSNRPSFDILESNISIILASQHTTTTKHLFTTLATSRSLYDPLVVNSSTTSPRGLFWLNPEKKRMRQERNSSPSIPDKGDSYINPKTQQNAIYTSAVVTENIQRAFNLVPDIPPHTTMDPDGPAAKGRKRTAIVIQNAVYRLDDLVDNLDASLVYVDEKLEDCGNS
ncbi:hypothetical protein BC829DRAFT_417524 [Chytridium lagenaria]|nr:hypothetical protein BC829DRAFT_417524 [Chytridium lagenaria]